MYKREVYVGESTNRPSHLERGRERERERERKRERERDPCRYTCTRTLIAAPPAPCPSLPEDGGLVDNFPLHIFDGSRLSLDPKDSFFKTIAENLRDVGTGAAAATASKSLVSSL